MFAYCVRCTFESPSARDSFLAWLRDRHVADVLAAGAEHADIVVFDGALALEVRYRFATREAFARYEAEHAPRLRADGQAEVARLGSSVAMTRATGEILSVA